MIDAVNEFMKRMTKDGLLIRRIQIILTLTEPKRNLQITEEFGVCRTSFNTIIKDLLKEGLIMKNQDTSPIYRLTAKGIAYRLVLIGDLFTDPQNLIIEY